MTDEYEMFNEVERRERFRKCNDDLLIYRGAKINILFYGGLLTTSLLASFLFSDRDFKREDLIEIGANAVTLASGYNFFSYLRRRSVRKFEVWSLSFDERNRLTRRSRT